MVLVMLSSTSCLYFGGEDALRGHYPYDITFQANYDNAAACTPEALERLVDTIRPAAGGRERGLRAFSVLEISGGFENGCLDVSGYSRYLDVLNTSASVLERVRTVFLLPLADYNRMAQTDLTLAPGEALIWSSGKAYPDATLTIEGCRTLRVHGTLQQMPYQFPTDEYFVTVYCVIVPDWTEFASELIAYVEGLNDNMIGATPKQLCSFNLPGVGTEEQLRIREAVIDAAIEENGGEEQRIWSGIGVSSYADGRSDFFSMYGSLFFLGIILSIVFIAAAALIIYYKQLSEGYEDQSRFGIMQKVGMTKEEIKSTINSQVLTVFFAPLLLAGLHLAFAFPFIQKIIRLFGVMNTPLLIGTNVICFLAFALFYVVVYRATARAYYAIVSAAEERRAA
jgi:putative ABC transport system permease protein